MIPKQILLLTALEQFLKTLVGVEYFAKLTVRGKLVLSILLFHLFNKFVTIWYLYVPPRLLIHRLICCLFCTAVVVTFSSFVRVLSADIDNGDLVFDRFSIKLLNDDLFVGRPPNQNPIQLGDIRNEYQKEDVDRKDLQDDFVVVRGIHLQVLNLVKLF